MSYSTGNPERDRLLLAAIKQVIAAKKTPSLKLVARALPEDFELDQEELDGALQFNFGPLPKSLENIEPPQANEPAQPHDPPAEPAPIPEMAARGLLAKAQRRLSTARDAMVIAQSVLKQRRADLADAIRQWQLLEPQQGQQTFEQLIRDTIRSNQQYKQDVKDGKVPPPRRAGPRGRSYIDASRGYAYRGDGNDFARRSNRETAGTNGQRVIKGHSRGSYSKTEAMHIEANRLRAEAAARKQP